MSMGKTLNFVYTIVNRNKGKTIPPNKGDFDFEFTLSEDLMRVNRRDPLGLLIQLSKSRAVMEGESAAMYSFASARALARLAAAMANGGSFEGHQILSEKGWSEFHAEPTL